MSLFVCLYFLSATVVAEVININKADASAFQLLKGIGEAKAKTIVLYRKKHGNFKKIEDLSLVKGIGEKTINKNKKQLSLTKGITTAPKGTKSKKTKNNHSKSKVTKPTTTEPKTKLSQKSTIKK